MKNVIVSACIFTVVVLLSCSIPEDKVLLPNLTGKCYNIKHNCCDSLDYMEFFNDSLFRRVSFSRHPEGPAWVTEGKYRIEKSLNGDSLFLITYDSDKGNMPMPGFKYLFIPDPFGFSIACYKSLKNDKIDITWQLSTIDYYVNSKHIEDYRNSPLRVGSIFIIPKNLEDYPMIALGQPDGADEEFTSQGARVFRLSEKGLLSTKSAARPLEFARGDYKVVWDSINGEELKFISQLCLMRMKGLSDKEISEMGFDLDAYYYHYPRYNPERESVVNVRFGKVMKGQVKSLRVHNLRDYLLKNYPNREAVKE